MYLFLTKFLPPLVYPLGFASILILAGLAFFQKLKVQRGLLVMAVVLLWLGGNRWISAVLVRSLEFQYLPSEEILSNTTGEIAEVIVLLVDAFYWGIRRMLFKLNADRKHIEKAEKYLESLGSP